MVSHSLYIGLMSGTSTDGVDGVLADLSRPGHPQIRAHISLPMPESLRQEFLALNRSGPNELTRAALAGNALARLYAQAVHALLERGQTRAGDVQAIGAHGQTVRHDPAAGYTLQINAPALLVELSRIAVIADFRTRDVAAGGQGAPLVPAFHQAVFSSYQPRAILNLGGIANVTVLHPGEPVRGFDTGPANVLLDTWCQEKTRQAYDTNGQWAAGGQTHPALLEALLRQEPWFDLPPPKSTGRDLFNRAWLERGLAPFRAENIADRDVQATLQSLTVHSIAQAIERHAPATREVLVCGGGALNLGLVHELEQLLARPVYRTDRMGVPVQLVEALAFAWLAQAHDQAYPAGLPEVTGASHPNILGCRYPV
ncbi:anhydro-N-acetylmuramic acid kinase [Paralcaligenes ureilyticus]|uniref:Anhydro-N-acetylmuramic acid kinase n=1 Tax=Paralcaligenes ureilyticus TaxID=627131 RepID=A0A4R3M6U5_9BURK|nr:anhydro-N-acetylmuramic acid kinase [Paralcaligenes ureilyticus]TCT09151.1 anhydro-N-acetylmuramic acid kinase [Paralcaligenes ureilyticus]